MTPPVSATSPIDVISRAALKIHFLKNSIITDDDGAGCHLTEQESCGLYFSFLSIAEELESAVRQIEAAR
ncbi:MAG: hypothetical protein ACOYL3_06995 [Desulfuromonadaceae bacterium]